MNISLSSIRISCLVDSPFLTRSRLSSLKIQKSSFNHFANSIFRISDSKNVVFQKSKFKNGLSNAVYLDSHDKTLRIWNQQIATENTGTFFDCHFDRIDSHGKNGSAIYSTVGLDISHCIFATIRGNYGAAIYNFGFLRLKYSTFARCSANYEADIRSISAVTQSVIISNCVFSESHADKLFASFFISSYGDVIFSTCNASNTIAIHCVGFGQVNHASFYMDHSNIIKTTSCYNAALVAEDTQKIFVESANFIKNFHKSNNPESASAILISNPAGNGYVQECNFLENTNEQGYIIYMQHLEMIVENCCFTKAKENREVNFQIKIVNSKIRNMCYTQTVRPNDVFGYVEPSENLMQKPNKGRNVSKSLQFSIMASILAVFIKYFWSNYVMHYILKPSKQIL